MGDMIHLHCDNCGFDEGVSVGWGMAMIGSDVFACYPCRRLVEHTIDARAAAPVDDSPVRCPLCKRNVTQVVVPMEPPPNPGRASPFRDVPCPKCGGTLHVDLVGIWD